MVGHDFAKRLRLLRLEHGVLQREMERILNLRPGTVSQYERGLREPGFDLLVTTADYFEVSVDYLLGRLAATKASPALQVARQRVQEILARDPLEAVDATLRGQRLLDVAAKSGAEPFTWSRCARYLRVEEQELRVYARGEQQPPQAFLRRLETYLGVYWKDGVDGVDGVDEAK